MIYGLTIPRTGTHFLTTLLEDYEAKVVHIWPKEVDTWSQLLHAGDPIIVPLRHPLEVAKSWKRREIGPGDTLKVLDLPQWWRLLIGVVDPAHPYYLPLDVPDRDNYLARICLLADVDLETDWPVLREDGAPPADPAVELTMEEWSSVTETIRDHLAFFQRFYPDSSYMRG